ncbi:MAG: hypothetical protein PHU28_06185 [Methanosarcinaceae archaeon]|nr:hypothetical protein [Methanosarcinaceae archaeon]
MKDFTIEKYQQLCNTIIQNGYNIKTLCDYIKSNPKSNTVILRHDIDSKPNKALEMAESEYDMEISSTYHFRYKAGIFDRKIIKKIYDMGHEIGYHYETLSKAHGNFEKAIQLFEFELNEFRKICEINTISMHGSPLSKYDNRDLWKVYNFEDYNIIGEAYLSVGTNFCYLSDTGRSWNPKNKIRDFIPKKKERLLINTTDELISLIDNKNTDVLYLLAHPGIWAGNSFEWYYSAVENIMGNHMKKLYNFANNRGFL